MAQDAGPGDPSPSAGLPPTSSKSLTVLVADDDCGTRRLVAGIIAAAGYQVREAADGEQAFHSIVASCPDLLISDWEMPRLNGLKLCQRLRAEALPHYLYMLLLTEKSNTDDMVQALAEAADDFITKPIVPRELLARLQAGTRMVTMERRLRHLSKCDPLTGALNRRTFDEVFEREWARAVRYQRPLSCIMLDIDFFKKVNDTHGHAAGDSTLKCIAGLLQAQTRTTDYVCRYGGEEFCILLAETTEADAAHWAERFRAALGRVRIQLAGGSLQLTASFGVVERLDDTVDPAEMIDMADQALLVAKRSGRDQIVRSSTIRGSLTLPALDGPLDGILARDVMTAAVLCPNQNDTIQCVADWFLQLRLGSAPVVDDHGLLVGMISEKDLMAAGISGDAWGTTIRDVMKTSVVSYGETTPAHEIYQFLCRVSIRRVVIVDEGRPTGVVSRDSLLRWFRNWITVSLGQDSLGHLADGQERRRLRASLLKTADAVARRSAELPRVLAGDNEDFVPFVVGEVTRLQDLINDLLGHCQTVRMT